MAEGWRRVRQLGRRYNVDMEKKAADNKKMLRPVFRLRMNAAGLFNRQTKRKFRGWGDAYNQKRAELPVLVSAVFILHYTCKRAP